MKKHLATCIDNKYEDKLILNKQYKITYVKNTILVYVYDIINNNYIGAFYYYMFKKINELKNEKIKKTM